MLGGGMARATVSGSRLVGAAVVTAVITATVAAAAIAATAATAALVAGVVVDVVVGLVFVAFVDQLLRVLEVQVAFGTYQHVVIEEQAHGLHLHFLAAVRVGGDVVPAVLVERGGHRGGTQQHQHLALGQTRLKLFGKVFVDGLVEQIALGHVGGVHEMAAGQRRGQRGETQCANQLLHS
jgi:hypothetical protein